MHYLKTLDAKFNSKQKIIDNQILYSHELVKHCENIIRDICAGREGSRRRQQIPYAYKYV